MSYLDFEQIKTDHPIDAVMQKLEIDLKQNGKQFRGKCPVCESGGDRNLVVTPDKGVYYCFSDGKGGDQLALAAHIKGCSVKEAAEWLSNEPEKAPQAKERSGKPSAGFKPLEYLEPDHEAVMAVGFDPEEAKALGIGYSPRGVLRGTVAVPVRNTDGSIAGYLGITEATLPPKWEITGSE